MSPATRASGAREAGRTGVAAGATGGTGAAPPPHDSGAGGIGEGIGGEAVGAEAGERHGGIHRLEGAERIELGGEAANSS